MIKQINKIANSEIIAELRTFPTQAAIWEIIDTGMSGEIFELEGGGVLIPENSNNPFVFIAGTLTDNSAQAVISFLQNRQCPMIYCKPSYHSFFLKRGFDLLLRAELVLKEGGVRSNDDSLGNTVKPIDNMGLFQKCFWYKECSEVYGSPENFLKHGKGYAYVEGDDVLSEAYATIGGGYMEVSVATHPDHRSRGYVAKALAPLVKECKIEGLIPIWTCQLDNRSSLKAAFKLGFEIDRYYVTMVPESGNVLG